MTPNLAMSLIPTTCYCDKFLNLIFPTISPANVWLIMFALSPWEMEWEY